VTTQAGVATTTGLGEPVAVVAADGDADELTADRTPPVHAARNDTAARLRVPSKRLRRETADSRATFRFIPPASLSGPAESFLGAGCGLAGRGDRAPWRDSKSRPPFVGVLTEG